ncbi:hypothetical protein [Streptomyces sp. NPDC047928]|uniref:hypothetical protein n=1 Tax=unclassified Streptomyces TaxID=2593676 RepID=UPI0037192B59
MAGQGQRCEQRGGTLRGRRARRVPSGSFGSVFTVHGVRRALVALAAVGAVLLTGCTAPGAAPPDADTRAIQSALDRRAAAVLAHATSPHDPAAREFANLADVPLSSWSYRVTSVRRTGDLATVRAELSHRVTGYDEGPVTGERVLELARRDGEWAVTGDRPAAGGARQLWQQGAVEVVRGRRSLVLGVGQDQERLRAVAAVADRAVPAVSDAWHERWAGRVVVLVPRSVDAMGELLGEPGAAYRGIAAVTTGRVGGGAGTPADRVIVNPDAYGVLGAFGREVVLTHETVHVATRAHTSAATPLWLSEGFADWVAYRGTERTAAQNAPELHRAVVAGDVPAALPEDGDFAFGGDADALARAYESGWLACDLIAERWGEAKLTEFYRAVGAHPRREGAVEKALGQVLSTTPEEFSRDWRDHLRRELG